MSRPLEYSYCFVLGLLRLEIRHLAGPRQFLVGLAAKPDKGLRFYRGLIQRNSAGEGG